MTVSLERDRAAYKARNSRGRKRKFFVHRPGVTRSIGSVIAFTRHDARLLAKARFGSNIYLADEVQN